MPSRHRNPAVVYRPDPELHKRAKKAVAEVGSDINSHVIAFMQWLVGDTNELPERPTPAAQQHPRAESSTFQDEPISDTAPREPERTQRRTPRRS
jgi:hypothetical protein